MGYFDKRVLKPEGSIMGGLATVGLVYGIYQLNVGNVSQAAATEPNHPVLENSRKKAGYTAAVLVAGISLMAHDANILILGAGTIVAMELSYRHAIMSHPETRQIEPPMDTMYEQPATSPAALYPVDDEAAGY